MKSLVGQLSQYAAYHRDIATHLVGIPMIVLGIEALLSRPSVTVHGLTVSVALASTVATAAFYFALDRRYGAVMAAVLGVSLWFGECVAARSTGTWLLGSGGLFLGGWVVQ